MDPQHEGLDRDALGKIAWRAWVQSMQTKVSLDLAHLPPWEQLGETVREVFCCVGEAVAYHTLTYAIGDTNEVASGS